MPIKKDGSKIKYLTGKKGSWCAKISKVDYCYECFIPNMAFYSLRNLFSSLPSLLSYPERSLLFGLFSGSATITFILMSQTYEPCSTSTAFAADSLLLYLA